MQQFTGPWIYRSFRNSTTLNQPFNDIRFGAGTMTFDIRENSLAGELDMGGNLKLSLNGTIRQIGETDIYEFRWTGTGLEGTSTQGWIYDYHGYLDKSWENGVEQATTLTGTVIRTVQHGSAPAGVVGTFHLVKL